MKAAGIYLNGCAEANDIWHISERPRIAQVARHEGHG